MKIHVKYVWFAKKVYIITPDQVLERKLLLDIDGSKKCLLEKGVIAL